jgi:EF hand
VSWSSPDPFVAPSFSGCSYQPFRVEKKQALAITATSLTLLFGIMTTSAQQPPTSPTMQNQQQAQRYQQEDSDTRVQDRDIRDEEDPAPGMTGEGRGMGMGHGMMGHGRMAHCGMKGQRGMMGPLMRIIFALMDPDADGTVSLEEFQAAHEKIFKAMDVNKDGTVSFEEMMNFMHGGRRLHRSPSAPAQ